MRSNVTKSNGYEIRQFNVKELAMLVLQELEDQWANVINLLKDYSLRLIL